MICGECDTNIERYQNLQRTIEQIYEVMFPTETAVKSFDELVGGVRKLLSEEARIKQDNFNLILGLGRIQLAAGIPSHLNPTPEEIARTITGRDLLPRPNDTLAPVIEAVRNVPENHRVRVLRSVAAYYEIEGEMG